MAENWETQEKYAKALAEKIKKSNFRPDVILAIEAKGVLIGKIIAKELNALMQTISIKRPVSEAKTKKRIPKQIIEVIKLFQSPRLIKGIDSSLKGKKILIVDNSISSGKTINSAKKTLVQIGVTEKSIRVASLYYLKGIITRHPPDYFLTFRRSRLFRPKAPKLSKSKVFPKRKL